VHWSFNQSDHTIKVGTNSDGEWRMSSIGCLFCEIASWNARNRWFGWRALSPSLQKM
jgi:hypothetical protein